MQTLTSHFKKINSNSESSEDKDDYDDIINIDIEDDSDLNRPFSNDEILKAIQSLKNGKACGDDRVINEFIKCTASDMSEVYVRLFNLLLESGLVPEAWTTGTIKTLYKGKGERHNLDNYRGITILSCLGKLYTLVLSNRIGNFIESNNMLKENQVAYRKGYCTLDHVFSLKCLLDIFLGSGAKIYSCFVDYSKAFDSINHSKLWLKLLKLGLNGKVLRSIKNI